MRHLPSQSAIADSSPKGRAFIKGNVSTASTASDERKMRTNYGLLYANGRSIHESPLQICGCFRSVFMATDERTHPIFNMIRFAEQIYRTSSLFTLTFSLSPPNGYRRTSVSKSQFARGELYHVSRKGNISHFRRKYIMCAMHTYHCAAGTLPPPYGEKTHPSHNYG